MTMDDYPAYSLDHNIPYIALLGLSPDAKTHAALPADLKDQAVLLRSDVAYAETKHGAALLEYLLSRDASSLPWNGTHAGYKLHVQTVGRTLVLPPRRARLPADVDSSQPKGALHSPFSPLSPACPLYPDGILDSRWLHKQQDLVPSVLLCFYNLTTDLNFATLHDNQIKSDVTALRNGLQHQGFKTRIVAVVMSDLRTSSFDSTQERLDNIRKGCLLDSKSFFYMPAAYSLDVLAKQADAMLTTVFGHAVEYYRDLGRRARKKKGRGVVPQPTVPPTSGTSQTLSLPGWNVRYDFKSAVFAEFRQEMDQALRSFEQAYETLTGPEVMDMIPSWNSRWNEARQLADIISIRCLRCMLWNGQTSAAVRRWKTHRHRMSDLVDRKGQGTNNYGWEAWEARWAIIMAQLLDKIEFPELSPSSSTLFLQPEKTAMGERLQPWELLHHPGYWFRVASSHLHKRRALALAMPEEDRQVVDASSRRKTNAFAYDTYMCPEPHEECPFTPGIQGVDHSKMIVECLGTARGEFQKRKQTRLSADIALELTTELVSAKRWKDALELVRPMWLDGSFRVDGWVDISEQLASLVRTVARETAQAELLVSAEWELLNKKYRRRENWHYDLPKSLEGISVDEKPAVEIIDVSNLPLLTSSFVFRTEEGNAGRTCQTQLAVTSNATPGSAPLVLSSIQVVFDGSIKTVQLKHDTSQDNKQRHGNVILSTVALREESQTTNDPESGASASISLLSGGSDLTLLPGHTMVYEMGVILREPGEAKASSCTLSMSNDAFTLDCIVRYVDSTLAGVWHTAGKPKKISRANTHAIQILPRPPNVEIKLNNVLDQYYTREIVELQFEIINAEDADADLELGVVLTVADQEPPEFSLTRNEHEEVRADGLDDAGRSRRLTVPLGIVKSTGAAQGVIRINPGSVSCSWEILLSASYHLVTDPHTPVVQTMDFQLDLVNPFEANYDLLARIHPDPWPSIFDHEGVQSLFIDDDDAYIQFRGLFQTWCLVTRFASFAKDDLKVIDVDLSFMAGPDMQTRISDRKALAEGGLVIKPNTVEEAWFDITAQRFSLDERDPVGLKVALVIKWRRLSDDENRINTSRLPVPRLGMFGAEPRVLASVSYPAAKEADGDDAGLGLVQLDIVVENASSHFLTFGLSMEPSEEFAFSGSKQATIHLLPVSRRSVTYRLLPLVRGAWIRPQLTVRDKYFQKLLRVIPTKGMKFDKEGFLVWIPPLEGGGGDEQGDKDANA